MRNYEKPSLQAIKLTADVICASPELLLTNAGSKAYENAEITFA